MTNTTAIKIRIDSMTPGERYALIFKHGEETAIFQGIQGSGDERRATFRSTDRDGREYVWDAYRYNGRWAYGTGADRLSAKF